MVQKEHDTMANEKLIPFLSGLYNATAITIKNGKPALPAELVYQHLKTLRRQQKVLQAHRLCEASMEENRNGWGGLQDYSKTASSMRREEMLLRSAFADVSESKKGKIPEQYQNHADFLKVQYRHILDDTFLKICTEVTGGEVTSRAQNSTTGPFVTLTCMAIYKIHLTSTASATAHHARLRAGGLAQNPPAPPRARCLGCPLTQS